MTRKFFMAGGWLAAFVLWTLGVCTVDVQAIGPCSTAVGLATINGWFHHLTGVQMPLYTITDWLGLVPIGICMGFAVLGLCQWIKRKRMLNVDFSILALGVFYLIVMAAYLFFESVVINYRPVLIDGSLEASYPSSTTLLTLCVMPTAAMQWKKRIRNRALRKSVSMLNIAFTAFMVIGRLLSGVHWLTDIIGGMLLSTGLVTAYHAVCEGGECGMRNCK